MAVEVDGKERNRDRARGGLALGIRTPRGQGFAGREDDGEHFSVWHFAGTEFTLRRLGGMSQHRSGRGVGRQPRDRPFPDVL